MNWRNMSCQFCLIKKGFITNVTYEWFLFIMTFMWLICVKPVSQMSHLYFLPSWPSFLCFFQLKYLLNLVSQRWHANLFIKSWAQKGYNIAKKTSLWGDKTVCTVVIDHIQTRSCVIRYSNLKCPLKEYSAGVILTCSK